MDQATDDFIHTLYDAVLEAEKWPVAVEKLAGLVDASHASLMDSDFAAGVVYRLASYGMNAEDNASYAQDYAAIDPRIPIALGHNKLTWLSDYEFFDEAFRKKDQFYREFMHPRGGGESLLLTFAREGSRMGTSVIVRDLPQPKVDDAMRRSLESLTLHMDRAIKLSRRFAAITSEAILSHTVLDALSEPLACVLSDGHLHRSNHAFESILRSGKILSVKRELLQIRGVARNQQFLRSVQECCRIAEGGTGGDPDAQFTIRVDQASGHPAFLTVAPLAAVQLKSWAGRPCSLVRIDQPAHEVAEKKLVDALSLSAAEARLVSALFGGGTLTSAAERTGISLNTAKTQLASVFSKTGVTRQSELIALISALPQ